MQYDVCVTYDDGTFWIATSLKNSGRKEYVPYLQFNESYIEKHRKFREPFASFGDVPLPSKDRKEGNIISRVFVENVGNLNIRSNKHTPSNL